MIYENIVPAVFRSRPNRFIAEIEIEGHPEICHVKNTGRCRELLLPGAEIYVQCCRNKNRKTGFDLISVRKGDMLINMDSSAPNKVFYEFATSGRFVDNLTGIKPECRYGNSRFDFFMTAGDRKIFAEVKGVTLESGRAASFPDAPTERGVKHLNELASCISDGYEAHIFFIIQMSGIKYMYPNWDTNPEFCDALVKAESGGVRVHAYECFVSETELRITDPVPVKLFPDP